MSKDRASTPRNRYCAPVGWQPHGANRGVLCIPNSPLVEAWARAYLGTPRTFTEALALLNVWERAESKPDRVGATREDQRHDGASLASAVSRAMGGVV